MSEVGTGAYGALDQAVSYLKQSAKAHPELDVRALLARATYVYEAEGFEQVRRAARIELGQWPGAEADRV